MVRILLKFRKVTVDHWKCELRKKVLKVVGRISLKV